MKPTIHELVLGFLTIIFLTFVICFSNSIKPEINIVTGTTTQAVPYYININTADAAELETLTGIGIKTANEIINYRNEHGKFNNVNELCEVSGIGTSTLDKIKDYIKV